MERYKAEINKRLNAKFPNKANKFGNDDMLNFIVDWEIATLNLLPKLASNKAIREKKMAMAMEALKMQVENINGRGEQ